MSERKKITVEEFIARQNGVRDALSAISILKSVSILADQGSDYIQKMEDVVDAEKLALIFAFEPSCPEMPVFHGTTAGRQMPINATGADGVGSATSIDG
jgi:hypothetical protein